MTSQTTEVATYIKGLEQGKGKITEEQVLRRMLTKTRTEACVKNALKLQPSAYGFLSVEEDGSLVCDVVLPGQASTRLESMRDDGTKPVLKLRRYILPAVGVATTDLSMIQPCTVGVDLERLPFEKLVNFYGKEEMGKAAIGKTVHTLLNDGARRDHNDRRSKDDKPLRIELGNGKGRVEGVVRRSLGLVEGFVEDFARFEVNTAQDENMQEKGRQMAPPSVRYPSKGKGRDDR